MIGQREIVIDSVFFVGASSARGRTNDRRTGDRASRSASWRVSDRISGRAGWIIDDSIDIIDGESRHKGRAVMHDDVARIVHT